MHELSVVKRILDICLKHAEANAVKKILAIELRIGKMSDLEPEWMQRYFDFASKGSVAEGAKLVIERIPIVLRCSACSQTFEINIGELKELQCPGCGGSSCSLVSGREYHISNMEVL